LLTDMPVGIPYTPSSRTAHQYRQEDRTGKSRGLMSEGGGGGEGVVYLCKGILVEAAAMLLDALAGGRGISVGVVALTKGSGHC